MEMVTLVPLTLKLGRLARHVSEALPETLTVAEELERGLLEACDPVEPPADVIADVDAVAAGEVPMHAHPISISSRAPRRPPRRAGSMGGRDQLGDGLLA